MGRVFAPQASTPMGRVFAPQASTPMGRVGSYLMIGWGGGFVLEKKKSYYYLQVLSYRGLSNWGVNNFQIFVRSPQLKIMFSLGKTRQVFCFRFSQGFDSPFIFGNSWLRRGLFPF